MMVDVYCLGVVLHQLLDGREPDVVPMSKNKFTMVGSVDGQTSSMKDQVQYLNLLLTTMMKQRPSERLSASKLVEKMTVILKMSIQNSNRIADLTQLKDLKRHNLLERQLIKDTEESKRLKTALAVSTISTQAFKGQLGKPTLKM